MKIFYWDFSGPNAEPTAQHFMKHLDDFLVKNGCTGCTTGLSSAGAGHHAVWCKAPPTFQEGIQQALRPQRIEDG